MDIGQMNFGSPTTRVISGIEAALSHSGNMHQVVQSILGEEGKDIYGEFTGDAMNMDAGVDEINGQIADMLTRAQQLEDTKLGREGLAALRLRGQAETLSEMRDTMLKSRELAFKAMSGATFTFEDLTEVFHAGGSILSETMFQVREGRLSPEKLGMSVAKMTLGGNPARALQATIDVFAPVSDWSSRYSAKKYFTAGETDTEIVINRLLGLGLRSVDPYLMAKGKYGHLESEMKKGFGKTASRRSTQIQARQEALLTTLQGAESEAERAEIKAEISGLSEDMLSIQRFMQTFVSETWVPKTKYGEKHPVWKDIEDASAPRALIGRVFNDAFVKAAEAFARAGVPVPEEGVGPTIKAMEKQGAE